YHRDLHSFPTRRSSDLPENGKKNRRFGTVLSFGIFLRRNYRTGNSPHSCCRESNYFGKHPFTQRKSGATRGSSTYGNCRLSPAETVYLHCYSNPVDSKNVRFKQCKTDGVFHGSRSVLPEVGNRTDIRLEIGRKRGSNPDFRRQRSDFSYCCLSSRLCYQRWNPSLSGNTPSRSFCRAGEDFQQLILYLAFIL